MATSGQIAVGVAYGSVTLTLECTGTSVEGNYTVWRATLSTYINGYISANANKPYSISVNGNTYSGNYIFGSNARGNKVIRVVDGIAIPHNGDGTKSFGISFSFSPQITYSGTYIGTVSTSGSIGCNTIPRASSFGAISGNTIGSTISFPINRASASFTHTIVYHVNGQSWQTVVTGATTSASFTLPIALCNYLPNSTSGTLSLAMHTYNGGTLIGTNYLDITVNIPSNIVPSIASINIVEATPNIASVFGVFVKNKSALKTTINASGVYASTIRTYATTIQGINYNAQTFTSAILTDSGAITVNTTVTDTRGRTASKSMTINCIDYFSPQATSFNVERCLASGVLNDEGTFVKCTFSFAIAPVNNKNTKSIKIQYLKGTNWIDVYTLSTYSETNKVYISTQTFTPDNSFPFRIIVSDYFSSGTIEKLLPTAFSLINFNESGRGIAFGKVSQKAVGIEFELPIYVKDKEVVTKDIGVTANISLRSGYPGFDDATGGFLRTPPNGLLPNGSGTGTGYIGTPTWRFYDGYFAHLDVTESVTAKAMYTKSWFRSYDSTGWYNQTYDGGIYMKDSKYVRVYNDKNFWCDKDIFAGGFRCLRTFDGNIDTFGWGNAEHTYIHVNTFQGSYGINVWASDKRLKEHIRDSEVNHALEKINQLQHVSFEWKSGGNCELGYVADDIEKVLPCLIHEIEQQEDEETRIKHKPLKHINHTTLIPLITMGMQELIQENKYLWEFNNAVVDEVCVLKEKIDTLESLVTKLLEEKGNN